MSGRRDPSRFSARTRAAYRESGSAVRGYVIARQAIAPVVAVEQFVPDGGRVLEFGCGMGIVSIALALGDPTRHVHGVDVERSRVEVARSAARVAGVADRVQFDVVDREWTPGRGGYDAVVVVDVLYLFEPHLVERIVADLLAALRPGGRLVVKEVGTRPRWKHLAGRFQERLAVSTFGFTTGDTLNPDPLRSVLSVARSRGAASRTIPMHRGYYYAHEAVTVDLPVE